MTKRKRTTVNLDPEVRDTLDAKSKYRGDKTRMINDALRQYFKKKRRR